MTDEYLQNLLPGDDCFKTECEGKEEQQVGSFGEKFLHLGSSGVRYIFGIYARSRSIRCKNKSFYHLGFDEGG